MTELTQYFGRIYSSTEKYNHTWEFKVDDRDGDVAPEYCNITLTTGAEPTQFTLRLAPTPVSD